MPPLTDTPSKGLDAPKITAAEVAAFEHEDIVQKLLSTWYQN